MKNIIMSLFVIMIMTNVQAQNRKENREKEVSSLLAEKRYKFIATKALTSLPNKSSVDLTDEYNLSITPDTVKCQLPFYGYTTSAPMGSTESPLFFESTKFTYDQQERKSSKKEYTLIKIEARSKSKSYTITLDVQKNGSATLNIRNNDLSNTTFWGRIE